MKYLENFSNVENRLLDLYMMEDSNEKWKINNGKDK
jgi:hypothetical protein